MIIIANLLTGLGYVLDSIIWFINLLIIASVVMSWVSADPRNPLVQFVKNVTEPIFYRVRKYVKPIGMLDLSPLVVLLGLQLVHYVVVQSMLKYGEKILDASMRAVN